MRPLPEISIIIPVYNEAHTIKDVILGIIEVMNRSEMIYELLIIDDGSTDGMRDFVDREIATLIPNEIRQSRVKFVAHEINKGYGAAIKAGILHSLYPTLVIIDGDGTYPFASIPELVGEIDSADMVVGSRSREGLSIYRRSVKCLLNNLANYLTGIKIPDLNSGLRVMKKKIVNRFMPILPDGFSLTTTITLAMLINGYRVKYIPIAYLQRKGGSKVNPLKDTVYFFQLIIRTIAYFKPLKVFLPLSSVFFILSFLALTYRFFNRGTPGVIALILFILGTQILVIGIVTDLINKINRGMRQE
ncbi:MAG: glycosyltransferase family 2 protein [Candidatus Omnitrophica bacterium]|nr:glycosyltransferase family 2 protein [Candidatus Omnitrophota bacterium]